MRSINKVILVGNLTRDPELKQTPGGQNIVTFGMATNREWITKDGRKNNLPEFHDVVAWANLAEICHKYLKKGKLVYVEGYLKTRNWELPDGTKKFRTEVVVQDMIMLDKRQGEDIESTESTGDYIPEEFHENIAHSSHESVKTTPSEQTKPADTKEEKVESHTETKTIPQPPSNPANVDIDDDLGL
jgi:single-strand DNA-binding protein